MKRIGTRDSAKYKCCNHPDRPARLPSHVLCEECFRGLDAKMDALAARLGAQDQKTGGRL